MQERADGAGATAPEIDLALARRLVAAQFPAWSHLAVSPVKVPGVDNRTFRLGDELTIRLPSADGYALQVAKEQRWLPVLAPQLPLPIPTPVARGVPGEGYPYAWSIYRWLDGEPAALQSIGDLCTFAVDLAGFLSVLREVDAGDGPPPGPHNFFRGGPLTTYADETHSALEALGDRIPGSPVRARWQEALAAPWRGRPVWFHGDVAVGNLLVRDGRLAAVIDFGTSGVGDPACDVVIAWTLFSGASREAFRHALEVDDGTWARARGWAMWKSLITLAGDPDGRSEAGVQSRRVIEAVLAD